MSSQLLSRPISKLVSSQIDRFSKEVLKSDFVMDFDIQRVIKGLVDGQKVGAIDMGGTKLSAQVFEISNSNFKPIEGKFYQYKNHYGVGYLDFLEQIKANLDDFPIGVSFAGTVRDNLLVGGHSNLKVFRSDMAKYQDDFRHVLPSVKSVVNDAVAGLIAAGVEASRQNLPQNVLYIICGSGLGGAVLKDEKIYSAEPGHIEVEAQLNVFHQTEKCVDGDYICIEKAGGGGLGVEWIYNNEIGQDLSGEEVSQRLQKGDKLAENIYDHTTNLIAHTILGLKKVFNLSTQDTTLAFHGGTFKVPGLVERLTQILESKEFLGEKVKILVMDDFSDNSCLEGAAISALV